MDNDADCGQSKCTAEDFKEGGSCCVKDNKQEDDEEGECEPWCNDSCASISGCRDGGDCSDCSACDCSKKCNPKAADFPGNNGASKCSGSGSGGPCAGCSVSGGEC